jgi:hypothetical protein
VVKNITVYATMHQVYDGGPSPASTGVEGSGSGALDMIVKSDVKESIWVRMWCVGRDAFTKMCEDQALLLYILNRARLRITLS